MLGEAMRALGNALIAMSREEASELIAGAGIIPTGVADALTATAPVSFMKAFAAMRTKAGRALSASNAEHLAEIDKALEGMKAAHAKAAGLHGKLNDALTEMQGHQANAADHAKALFEAGKKPDPDEDPEAEEDGELAFAAAQRKRRAAVIALRA
jgi:hypothetical protein